LGFASEDGGVGREIVFGFDFALAVMELRTLSSGGHRTFWGGIRGAGWADEGVRPSIFGLGFGDAVRSKRMLNEGHNSREILYQAHQNLELDIAGGAP
jgi:hypothetical protein